MAVAGGLFFGLTTGVAFADHSGGTEWTCNDEAGAAEGEFCGDRNAIGPAAEHALAPVGRNISDQGLQNGYEPRPDSGANIAIQHNPLCPFHGVEATP